jgi:hypothetical protein
MAILILWRYSSPFFDADNDGDVVGRFWWKRKKADQANYKTNYIWITGKGVCQKQNYDANNEQ